MSICPPCLCVPAVCMYAMPMLISPLMICHHAYRPCHVATSFKFPPPYSPFALAVSHHTSTFVVWRGVLRVLCVFLCGGGGIVLVTCLCCEESLTFDAFYLDFIYLLICFWTRMVENGGVRTLPPSPPPFVDSHRD